MRTAVLSFFCEILRWAFVREMIFLILSFYRTINSTVTPLLTGRNYSILFEDKIYCLQELPMGLQKYADKSKSAKKIRKNHGNKFFL